MRGASEVWRMWRSESAFETVVALGVVAAWLVLSYRKMQDSDGNAAGGNRLNR